MDMGLIVFIAVAVLGVLYFLYSAKDSRDEQQKVADAAAKMTPEQKADLAARWISGMTPAQKDAFLKKLAGL